MRKFFVSFSGGESRYSNDGCDYMLCEIPGHYLTEEQREAMEENGMACYPKDENYEFYAEVNPLDYAECIGMTAQEIQDIWDNGGEQPDELNEATYDALKEMILEQAKDVGFPAEQLVFEV